MVIHIGDDMGTKKIDTETRQRQIVEEALGIVAQHGLEGLSVAELGNRTGLVPSGVYRHFEGKDQIILAVLDFVRDHLFRYLQAVRQETSDPVDRLRRLFYRHLKLLKDNPGIPRVVFGGAVFSADVPNRDKASEIIEGLQNTMPTVYGHPVDRRIRAAIEKLKQEFDL